MITIHRRELLAACRDKPLRQIVICIQQQLRHVRRKAAARYLMFEEEATDGIKVKAYRRWHDMERTAYRQYREQVLYVRIKRERTMSGDAVTCRQFLYCYHVFNEVPKTSLMNHRALWLTCRTRCVDHVGQTAPRRQVHRINLLAKVCLRYKLTVYHNLCLAVIQHVFLTLLRIVQVDRHVCRTSLVNGQHRKRERYRTVKHHGNKVVGNHPTGHQPASQHI